MRKQAKGMEARMGRAPRFSPFCPLYRASAHQIKKLAKGEKRRRDACTTARPRDEP